MKWADAVETWKKEGGTYVGRGQPKRGTPEYEQIVAIMRRDDPSWSPPKGERAKTTRAARAAKSLERLRALGVVVPPEAVAAAGIVLPEPEPAPTVPPATDDEKEAEPKPATWPEPPPLASLAADRAVAFAYMHRILVLAALKLEES